jgi:hypothetical protein
MVAVTKSPQPKGVRRMRKLFQYGGIAASVVLIAFGLGAIYRPRLRCPPPDPTS